MSEQNRNGQRHDDEFLLEYFEICKRIYERHVHNGTWPWSADSTNFEDVVDSESLNDDEV